MTGPHRKDHFDEEPDFDPAFDLPEPDPADDDDIPDAAFSDDIDLGPKDSIPKPDKPDKPDAWDKEQGYDVEEEDIAIVAWAAVLIYRQTHGSHSEPNWMHAPKEDRDKFMGRIKALLKDKGRGIDKGKNTEDRLIIAVVRALRK
jgi:hypothetical protein